MTSRNDSKMKRASSEFTTDFLTRGVSEVLVRKSVERKLKSGKALRIKHGVDPTSSDLHLGYAAVYLKLRELQQFGHTIIFLIGDFTARFGDPTNKTKVRELKSKEEVVQLSKEYLHQAGKLIDLQQTELRYNSEWYENMKLEKFLKIASAFTVPRLLERDMFSRRLKQGQTVQLHEITYPVLQGYDSVMLKSDLTVIGSDQVFNELQARILQQLNNQPPQDLIATKLLVGTDGKQKMSQSLDNYIGFNDSPPDMYGKIMSLNDQAMPQYFELLTRVPQEEIKELLNGHPRDAKMRLAREILALFYSTGEIRAAEERFVKTFQQKTPQTGDLPRLAMPKGSILLDAVIQFGSMSKSEAKRLFQAGGIRINYAPVTNWNEAIDGYDNNIIQIGKKKFARILIQPQ